jgi:hypothetical protein
MANIVTVNQVGILKLIVRLGVRRLRETGCGKLGDGSKTALPKACRLYELQLAKR